MRIDDLAIDFPVYLAPMAGISDISFRTLMRELGCGVGVTELISSEAMVRENRRTKRMLRTHEFERPVGMQIFGHDANAMAETAKMVEAAGADFVDINLGCPVRKITKQGAGAALLQDLPSLEKILLRVKEAITIPLTIKIRTGFCNGELTYKQVIELAYNCGVAAVAIHGRTREQAYEGEADWEAIADAKQHSLLPIIGNGDLTTYDKALEKWRASGCDAIMIGRGALRNPWIFLEIRAALAGKDPYQPGVIERDLLGVISRHAELLQTYEEPRTALLQMKKFLAWYLTAMPGCGRFRAHLFTLKSFDTVFKEAIEFIAAQRKLRFGVESGERFLMGGHG